MFSKVLYACLKALVLLTFRIYFRRVAVINKEGLRLGGPFLVVCNHPNTMMDAVGVVANLRKQTFFLANYSLFKHPVANFLLTRLYCIPIQRTLDVDGGKVNNENSFIRCRDHLKGGGSIFIAPEGTSFVERTIRPFKTGAARIALDYQTHCEAPLRILPVGLIYTAPEDFRSDLVFHVGEPVNVPDFVADYRRDPRKGVRALTELLEQTVKGLTLHCVDEEQDVLLHRLETILENDRPLPPPARRYHNSRALLANLNDWSARNPSEYGAFEAKVTAYFDLLKQNGLDDQSLIAPRRRVLLYYLLVAPLFVYGAAFSVVPALFAASLVKKIKLYHGYDSTVKYVASLVSFPVFYIIVLVTLCKLLPYSFIPWIAGATFIPAGLAAWSYWKSLQRYRQKRKFEASSAERPAVAKALLAMRRDILSALIIKR